MKKKIIASVLSLAMCASLVAGGTYALFTSNSETNIAINAGQVKVVATLQNLEVYSPTLIGADGSEILDETNAAVDGVFANGGTAVLSDKKDEITLTNMTPGDKATFEVKVENQSNVAIKYQTVIKDLEDDGLFAGLAVTIDDVVYSGDVVKSDWYAVDAGAAIKKDIIKISVELPTTANDDYQNKKTVLNVNVNAIQGNAEGVLETTERRAHNDAELAEILADLDGVETIYLGKGTFNTFNIEGKNLDVIGEIDANGNPVTKIYSSQLPANNDKPGVWEWCKEVNFKNVIFEAASGIEGGNGSYQSALNMEDGVAVTFENCKFVNQGVHISGNAAFTDCVFEGNGTGFRGIAFIPVYTAVCTWVVDNCSFSNYTDVSINVQDGGNSSLVVKNSTIESKVEIGALKDISFEKSTLDCTVKLWLANTTYSFAENCTFGDNFVFVDHNDAKTYFVQTKAQLVNFAKNVNDNKKNYIGETVKLVANIDLNNEAWTPIGQTGATQFLGTFDGNGKTISNLTIDTTGVTDNENYSTGLFGWLNSATVKNLTIDGANVQSLKRAGVIAGYLELGSVVENCIVKNATVVAKHVGEGNDNNTCGDKAGAVVGYMNSDCSVIECAAIDCKISAGRDAGQVVGAGHTAKVTGCTATNVTVTALNDGCKGGNINVDIIGRKLS